MVMSAAAFLALVSSCAPQVDADTAAALVAVESSFNPHAIGVVHGALDRQPRRLRPGSTGRRVVSRRWRRAPSPSPTRRSRAWAGRP